MRSPIEFEGQAQTLRLTRRTLVVGAVVMAAAPSRAAASGGANDIVPLSPEINAEVTATSATGLLGARASALISRGIAPSRARALARRPGATLNQQLSADFLSSLQPMLAEAELDLIVRPSTGISAKDLTYPPFKIRWADDHESVDARHLLDAEAAILGGPAGPGSTFLLTPATLAQICASNSFVPLSRSKAPCVLFGIRGALPAGDDSGWTTGAKLTLDVPNHFERRCTLGVWYRGTSRPESIRVFPGSTVPNARYMADQAKSAGDISNLPPTGLHRYVVGEHRQTIDSAFKQAEAYPAHRLPHRTFEQPSPAELCYTNAVTPFSWPQLARKLPINAVGVDIHPAFLDDDPIQFSSAGCQVIRGSQGQRRQSGGQVADGAWESFRLAAGLVDPPGHTQDGTQYDYLLVSAREAMTIARASSAQLPLLARLRFGSADGGAAAPLPFPGVSVRSFQRALISACRQPGPLATRVARCALPSDFAADGRFFGGTMRLVLAWQAEQRGYVDGIVDRAMLVSLELV